MAVVLKPLRLPKILKAYRQKYDVSQREMARQLGISASTYCRFEQGQDMDGHSTRAIVRWLLGEETSDASDRDGNSFTQDPAAPYVPRRRGSKARV